jgi:hypothetical protein
MINHQPNMKRAYINLQHRIRVLIDRIPQVLVNLYFCRGLSGKGGNISRMSG